MLASLWIPLAPVAAAVAPAIAAAAVPPAATPSSDEAHDSHELPPDTSDALIQYGVAFTVEGVASAGPLCVDPCFLSSGGGVAVRVGHRSAGPIYYGLAYELSKQGSNNIYRLGILQQLRLEGRYYPNTGRAMQPFLQAGAGVTGYGNEWAIDTKGPMLSAGAGAQIQISRNTVVGVGVSYRALLLSSFTDSTGAYRPSGVASLLGIDFLLEAVDLWPFSSRR
jgi:hypothetical protein